MHVLRRGVGWVARAQRGLLWKRLGVHGGDYRVDGVFCGEEGLLNAGYVFSGVPWTTVNRLDDLVPGRSWGVRLTLTLRVGECKELVLLARATMVWLCFVAYSRTWVPVPSVATKRRMCGIVDGWDGLEGLFS